MLEEFEIEIVAIIIIIILKPKVQNSFHQKGKQNNIHCNSEHSRMMIITLWLLGMKDVFDE